MRLWGNLVGKGLPIGNLTSQHFANVYLGELDLFVKNTLRIKGYVRYMDDFIVFGDTKEELRSHLAAIEAFANQTLKLSLNKRVEIIAPVSRGIPFLGFNIYTQLIRVKRENLVRLRRKIRLNHRLFREGRIDEKKMVNSCRSMLAHISEANTMFIRRKEFA
jgi:RNA-directed DNA polymerase